MERRSGGDYGRGRAMGMGDGPGDSYRDRDRLMDRERDRPMVGERERDGMMGGYRGPDRGPDRGLDRPVNAFGRPAGMGPMGPRRDFGPRQFAPDPNFQVDREKTCPLLLRVWTKNGGHHRLEDFAVRGKEPPGDIQVYTWMDATLRELSDLIKEVKPEARSRGSRLSFSIIYPDKFGRNVVKQVGQVHSSRQSEDDRRTLKSIKFQTGDFMDVAVLSGMP